MGESRDSDVDCKIHFSLIKVMLKKTPETIAHRLIVISRVIIRLFFHCPPVMISSAVFIYDFI